MKHKYFFEISDLLLQVESNKELQTPKCFQPFESASASREDGDIVLEVIHSTEGIGIRSESTRLAPEIFYQDGDIITRYTLNESQEIFRWESGNKDKSYRLYIPKTFSDNFCRQGKWLHYMEIERLFAPHHRLFLHASTVIYRGKAYLFAGPSGSGKSSHASIWEEEYGATILNGDKALISVSPDGCKAYGSPVAGSSEIYRNQSAPIAAIFFIEKSNRNYVDEISSRKAFLALYSEAIKSKWDTKFNSNILEMAELIRKTTPVYTLECLPEKSAVECILQTLGEKYET